MAWQDMRTDLVPKQASTEGCRDFRVSSQARRSKSQRSRREVGKPVVVVPREFEMLERLRREEALE